MHDKFDVKPRIKITGINVEKYIIFGPFTIDPEESVNQWIELEGTSFFKIDGYENMTPEEKGKVSQYLMDHKLWSILYATYDGPYHMDKKFLITSSSLERFLKLSIRKLSLSISIFD